MFKKNNISLYIFLFIIFCFCFIFFSKIHPLVVLDSDDWTYISEIRYALPAPSAWNPTRVLPETLMPLFSQLGVSLFLPITNSYIFSLTLIHSIVVSLFITLYLYCFIKLLKTKFKLDNFDSICISTLFFMLHFLILKNSITDNKYMFYAPDLTCYYFYLIPSLINVSLLMYFIADDTLNRDDNSKLKISILILITYLAIFSNLFQSIILATYIFANLLIKYLKMEKRFKLKQILSFIKNNILQIICMILWLIAQIFEVSGGRANSIKANQSFFNNISESITNLIKQITSLNKLFLLIFVVTFISFIVIAIIKKYYKKKNIMVLFISFVLTTIYLILLSSACGPGYILRSDAIYAILFYLIFIVCMSVTLFKSQFKFIMLLFPLGLFILFFFIDTSSKTFAEPNYLNLSYKEIEIMDNIIINQIKDASKSKEKSTIYIPEFNGFINWPMPKEGIVKVINTLYKHGIIDKTVDVDVEVTYSLDKYIEKYSKKAKN